MGYTMRKGGLCALLAGAVALGGCAKAIWSPLAACEFPDSIVKEKSGDGYVVVRVPEVLCRKADGEIVLEMAAGLEKWHELYGVECRIPKSKMSGNPPSKVFTKTEWCEPNGGNITAYMSYPLQVFSR